MKPKQAFAGRVIFDHLPKTAGQAVNAWLRNVLGDGCVTDNLVGYNYDLIQQYGGKYSVLSGHINFLGKGLYPLYDYVTCFRHPVDRIISWIYFILENHADQDIVELRQGVKAFLDSNGNEGQDKIYNNIFTHHLCSAIGYSPQNSEDQIECALSVLNNYALWGLYERLPDFIEDFANYLQVPVPAHLPQVNITAYRPKVTEISSDLRAKIEELNAIDIAFYKRLQERYDEDRQNWHRPAVTASPWLLLKEPPVKRFCDKDFILLSYQQEGGYNVNQHSVLNFSLEFSLFRPIDELECGIHIHDKTGKWAFGINSTLNQILIGPLIAGRHRVCHSIISALPEGQYDVGFAFAEKTPSGQHDLAWVDKLGAFQVSLNRIPYCVGYASLPAAMNSVTLSDEVVTLPKDGSGCLHFTSEIPLLQINENFQLSITLVNQSQQTWVGTVLHPLYLSYRWLNEAGEVVVADGLRTKIPNGQLALGQQVEMTLSIQTPNQPGSYMLQVMPVSELYAWFDSLGFIPSLLPVEIISPTNIKTIKS